MSAPPWKGSSSVMSEASVASGLATAHLSATRENVVETHGVHVLAATWNVNGKALVEDLHPWLNEVAPAPDIVAVGFQELDLSAEAFIRNNSSKAPTWEADIAAALAGRDVDGGYVHVASKQLVGILLVVFVKARLAPHVSLVASDSVGVGVLGVMGNKGGVGLLLRVFDEEWLLLNSHLAAGQGKAGRRNQDYAELARRMVFDGRSPADGGFDAVVWMGDLNYRIDLPNDTVRSAIAVGDYALLRKSDQLLRARSEGKAFVGFLEGKLAFVPTYKYDNGTNLFDSSSKNRIPAWTDRVLYKYAHPGAWRLISYTTTTALLTSDHKPVSAHFLARASQFRKAPYRAAAANAAAAAAALASAPRADILSQRLDVSTKHIRLGVLTWATPVSTLVTVTNPSATLPAMFGLVRDASTGSPTAPWLSIVSGVRPGGGILAPGESLTIELVACVGPDAVAARAVRPNSDGTAHLESLLQFTVQGASTNPVAVVALSAVFEVTALGGSLNSLTRASSSEVPEPLWYLMDALALPAIVESPQLMTGGLDLERPLTATPALAELIGLLEAGRASEIPAAAAAGALSPPALLGALFHLLASLSTPVIPPQRTAEVLGTRMDPVPSLAGAALVDSLPLAHYNVFWYVTAFIRHILLARAANGAHYEDVLTQFAQVLMYEPSDIGMWPERIAAKVEFLELFVDPDGDLLSATPAAAAVAPVEDDEDPSEFLDPDDFADPDDLVVRTQPAPLLVMSPPSTASPMRRSLAPSSPSAAAPPSPSPASSSTAADLMSINWDLQ